MFGRAQTIHTDSEAIDDSHEIRYKIGGIVLCGISDIDLLTLCLEQHLKPSKPDSAEAVLMLDNQCSLFRISKQLGQVWTLVIYAGRDFFHYRYDLIATGVSISHKPVCLSIQLILLRVRRHPRIHRRYRQSIDSGSGT